MSFLTKILGDPSKRVLRSLESRVDQVNSLEPAIKKLSDEKLRQKTAEFKKRVESAAGEIEENKVLDEILPEAFAVMREAMRRVWNERHFDVQIIGGVVLHQGKIAEMKTGEGKTIVAALPLYLNALIGRGVHLITVNDYLARHQGEGMGEVYNFLGLSTGVVQGNQQTLRFKKNKDYKHYSEVDGSNLEPCSRTEAYACDITYGTNNEFGFDYLRDNMVFNLADCVQRGLNFSIVDEVDSILIDEARTPLIISGPAAESTSLYQQFAALVPRLKESEDYIVDEKDKVVSLTDSGIGKMEKMLGLKNIYDVDGIVMVHHLEEALKAHTLFKRDRDYIIKDGEIVIVDEFTGRLMIGRRYSEGLHQAIEAKESVEVKQESQTLATISFQNLFRLYKKLAGMTGTAATEAEEFYKIYKLDVVEIPTNKTVVRKDSPDKIYKTEAAKFAAVVDDIKARQENGQPVLVGTVSVSKNEILSKLLKMAGVKHEVLNAKNHEREAKIITKAGQKGAVTVATNMAGRGTDIKLGEGIVDLGGLHVVGTERHEARRIDNQLRGRAGRQGDPGSSQFYVSLEDDLMRIFGGERIKSLMNTLGLPDDMPVENSMISRSIESAQRKVEGHNFDIRKHLVEYDDVINKHREVIYRLRQEILETQNSSASSGKTQNRNLELESAFNSFQDGTENESRKSLRDRIINLINDEAALIVQSETDEEQAKKELTAIFGEIDIPSLDAEILVESVRKIYAEREKKFGEKAMREIEKVIYLRTIDMLWIEHLTTMDELRTGIGLRGYGQRDPLVEYKQEAYRLFQNLRRNINASIARTILKVEIQVQPTAPIRRQELQYEAPDADQIGGFEDEAREIAETAAKINRESRAQEEKQSFSGAAPDNGGVSVTVRHGGKTVFERMSEANSGHQGTIKSRGKVGRNDPCPCGSGKKYKKCHGR